METCTVSRKLLDLLIAGLVVGLIFIWPTGAGAAVSGDWGAYAAVANRFAVPLPDAYVHHAGCPDGSGSPCASSDQRDPDVWMPWAPVGAAQRFALAHELGHRFDAEYLTDGDRMYFARIIHAPSGPWRQDSGLTADAGGEEWFADFYAACAVRMRFDGSTPNFGDYAVITEKRLRHFCGNLRFYAARRGITG
jgi:hypothetical protein